MAGGGASYFPSRPNRLQGLVKQTLEEAEHKRVEGDVNTYLQQLLARIGERDTEKIQAYVDSLAAVLGEGYEIQKLLFGGSFAKRTFVDGLSDVDALVVLNRSDLEGKSPAEVLREFFSLLDGRLARDEVASVGLGDMAVTVTYRDGTEIQLLPAVRRRRAVCIADETGDAWKVITPKVFQRDLKMANDRLNSMLIPTIKLVKAIKHGFPEELRPSGYHVEALSVDATKGYRGPLTLKSLLLHTLTAASNRVLYPIADVTNQTRKVDGDLGKKNSEKRVKISLALAGVARRLNAASTVDRWKEIIEQ